MIVIMLSDCPPKVRGDLSKWLCEINTGVFVGNVSSRVREEVWQRICENIKSGQATMVFSAPGEQKMDFRVHNTTWEEFSMLIRINGEIPVEIQKLTGITEQELQSMGRPLEEVLEKLFEFAGNRIIVGHNVAFDYNFIRAACRKMKLEMRLGTASRDTLALSRRKIKGVGSYQLEALMKHLGYEVSNAHRALADCYLTWQLYQKLNEM